MLPRVNSLTVTILFKLIEFCAKYHQHKCWCWNETQSSNNKIYGMGTSNMKKLDELVIPTTVCLWNLIFPNVSDNLAFFFRTFSDWKTDFPDFEVKTFKFTVHERQDRKVFEDYRHVFKCFARKKTAYTSTYFWWKQWFIASIVTRVSEVKALIKWEAQTVARDMWVIVGAENKLISHFKGFGIVCYLQPRAKILFY